MDVTCHFVSVFFLLDVKESQGFPPSRSSQLATGKRGLQSHTPPNQHPLVFFNLMERNEFVTALGHNGRQPSLN